MVYNKPTNAKKKTWQLLFVIDHHRRQHPITMNRRRAPLERLAKRGLLLVVNGAPIDAAANVHERPQRRPQATARRCRHRHCNARYCSAQNETSLRFEKIATPWRSPFEESLREVPSRSPFGKSLREVPSRSPFGNVPSVRSARARLARSAHATAPRAAVRGGRPRSLRVRPRAADWRTQGVTSQNPTSTVKHTLHT